MGLQDLKKLIDVGHGLFCAYQKVREVEHHLNKQTNQTNGAIIRRTKYSAVKSSRNAKNIQMTQTMERKQIKIRTE